MSDEREVLHETLRRFHLGDPRPALRARTLNAMREELARPRTTPYTLGWLAAWRVEALYAAAILACLVFLSRPGPHFGAPTSAERPAPSVSDEPIVRELGLAGDLARHVNARLVLQRQLREKRIHPHDFQRDDDFASRYELPPS